jgi:hypothetical protein
VLLPTWHAFVNNLIWFGTGDSIVSLLEKILRPVVVYLGSSWRSGSWASASWHSSIRLISWSC